METTNIKRVKGIIMPFENCKPTEFIRKYERDGEERKLEVCRFKIKRTDKEESELIEVQTTNRGAMAHLTAGREIIAEGEFGENPRTATNKAGEEKEYRNPRIWRANVTFADTPLRKQVTRVLSLAKEQNLLDEEKIAELEEKLQAVVQEKFNNGRVPLKKETVVAEPNGVDDDPLS